MINGKKKSKRLLSAVMALLVMLTNNTTTLFANEEPAAEPTAETVEEAPAVEEAPEPEPEPEYVPEPAQAEEIAPAAGTVPEPVPDMTDVPEEEPEEEIQEILPEEEEPAEEAEISATEEEPQDGSEETVSEEEITAEDPEEPEEQEEDTEETEEEYTLVFSAEEYGYITAEDGAEETEITLTVKEASELPATITAAAREGYEFVEWTRNDEHFSDKAKIEAYELELANNDRYVAKFQLIPEEEEEPEETPKEPVVFRGSANGIFVTVTDRNGAFPEGTKMVVSAVETEAVIDAVNGAIEGEAMTVKAVDITFYLDGEEVHPDGSVEVKMTTAGMSAENDRKVIHVDDNGEASVVARAATEGGLTSSNFETDGFSIYLVVEEDQPVADENAVATYEFYVDGKLVQTQYLKTGDKPTDPGSLAIGADDANTVFKGWYIGTTPVDFDTAVTVAETTTVRVDAKIEHTYYVTFWGEKDDEGNRGIVAVKSVTVEGDATGTVTTDDVVVTPKKDTSAFKGWATDAAETTMAGATVTVSKRMDLYAVVVNAHWLHFYENVGEDSDSDATYTGPVFIAETDVRSAKKPADPTRKGYKFGGWYLEEACTTAFDWTATGLDKDTDLYAKWTPDTADYKVIVWKQKVTDAKNAAESARTYDFESSTDLTGTTGDTLNKADFTAYTEYNYTGFHYGRIEIVPETIKADGSP